MIQLLDGNSALFTSASRVFGGAHYQLVALTVLDAGGNTVSVGPANAVPVSGPLTNSQLRESPVPVSGPLTDAQLRAGAVPVSLTDEVSSYTLSPGNPDLVIDCRGSAWVVVEFDNATFDYVRFRARETPGGPLRAVRFQSATLNFEYAEYFYGAWHTNYSPLFVPAIARYLVIEAPKNVPVTLSVRCVREGVLPYGSLIRTAAGAALAAQGQAGEGALSRFAHSPIPAAAWCTLSLPAPRTHDIGYGLTAEAMGRLITAPCTPTLTDRGRVVLTGTGETEVIAAASGVRHLLNLVVVANRSANAVSIDIRTATAGAIALTIAVAPNSTQALALPTPWTASAVNAAITAQASGTAIDAVISIQTTRYNA